MIWHNYYATTTLIATFLFIVMTPNLRKRIASQVLSNKPITVQRRSLAKRAKVDCRKLVTNYD